MLELLECLLACGHPLEPGVDCNTGSDTRTMSRWVAMGGLYQLDLISLEISSIYSSRQILQKYKNISIFLHFKDNLDKFSYQTKSGIPHFDQFLLSFELYKISNYFSSAKFKAPFSSEAWTQVSINK